jgi:Cys-tRNA(Pro)/Cys-tRNA(Cys) deacylase
MHPRVEAQIAPIRSRIRVHRHADHRVPINTPADFAAALGYTAERVLKAIFLKCSLSNGAERFALAVCSTGRSLDLPSLTARMGGTSTRVARSEDLKALLGYPPKGVSPLGAPAGVIVFVDENVLAHPTVLVGAGQVGVELELAPDDLVALSSAEVGSFASPATSA